jgi:hypothetical protein
MREHLLDEAFDRYLDWRAESEAACEAYGRWSSATRAEGADSFDEERAASVYSTLVGRLAHMFVADIELAPAASGAPRL